MELLAPAGSPAHLIAALDAGADAVYLGGKRFSARKFAGNFSDEEMKEAVRMAHGKGASVYVTLNTLIGDMENKALADYLQFLGTISIDGKSAGTMKTNLGGKLSVSVELEGADKVAIKVEKR